MKIKLGKLLGTLRGAIPIVRMIAPKVVPPVAVAVEVVEAADAVNKLVKGKKK